MRLKNIFSVFALFLLFFATLASVSAAEEYTVIAYSYWNSAMGREHTIFYGDSTIFIAGARTLVDNPLDIETRIIGEGVDNLIKWHHTEGKEYQFAWRLDPSEYKTSGKFQIVTTVTGKSGDKATDTLTLIVKDTTEGNTRPVVNQISTRSVEEHKTYFEQITATDADNDHLTFSLDQAPAGMTIDNNGLIQWVAPEVNGEKNYAVTVRVSDGKDFSVMTYTLKVTDADSTVLAYSYWTGEDGRMLIIYNKDTAEFVAGARTFDSNELPMTGKVELLDQYGNVVHSEVFDPGSKAQYSKLLSITPEEYGERGSYTLRTTVTGKSGAVSTDDLMLRVLNNAPTAVLALSGDSITESETLAVTVNAEDLDGDLLTVTTDLEGADINGDTISFSPGYNFVVHPSSTREVTAVVMVSDGTDSVTKTFSFKVNDVNRNPAITSTPITDGKEGTPYSYQAAAADADAEDSLHFTLVKGVLGMELSDSGLLTWNSPEAGDYEVEVGVEDGFGGSAAQSFTLHVESIEVLAPRADAGGPYTCTVGDSMTLDGSAADGTAPYSFAWDLDDDGSFETAGEDASYTCTVEGTHRVSLKVTDSKGNTDTDSTAITVNPAAVNNLPEFDPTGDKAVSVENTLEFTVRAADADGDALTMGLTGQPIGSTFQDNGDGTASFSWTPTADQVGEYTLTFHADDGKGESILAVKVSVISVEENLPPVISSIEDQEVLLGDTFTYQVAASDPENDPLTYSLTAAPAGMIISDSGVISWEPAKVETHTVEISVSDGTHTVIERFVIRAVDKKITPGENPVITEEGLRFESVRLLNGEEMALGEPLALSVKVSNYGEVDYENLKLTALVMDTGDYKRSRLFNLKGGESEDVGLVMDIPYLVPGEYDLRIVVSSDNVRHVLHRQFAIR